MTLPFILNPTGAKLIYSVPLSEQREYNYFIGAHPQAQYQSHRYSLAEQIYTNILPQKQCIVFFFFALSPHSDICTQRIISRRHIFKTQRFR